MKKRLSTTMLKEVFQAGKMGGHDLLSQKT